MMGIFDLFKRREPTASIAKDRLQIIVARERRVGTAPSYLPQLQQELLAVVAKYEKLDLDHVTVNVDQREGGEVLELNIMLPEDHPAPPKSDGKRKRRKKRRRGASHLQASPKLAHG